MFERLLSYLAEKGSLRLTEISRSLDLPPSMAASLVLQLEDAGFIEEDATTRDSDGGGCSGSCGGNCGGSCGGCQIDPPYRLTEAGRAFLASKR